MKIPHFNSGNILFYKETEKMPKTQVRRRLKKFKCNSGRQDQNISCGPDSPLFELPLQSHLANYE